MAEIMGLTYMGRLSRRNAGGWEWLGKSLIRFLIQPEAVDWSKVKNFRKWEYDLNTIARDVLSSLGSPLEYGPHLNEHLPPLLRNSTYVDANSDLATIRWDLVVARGPKLVYRLPLKRRSTMQPGSEEQHRDAQNLVVRSPLKPTRGGMVSGGFGGGRISSTLPSTSLGRHLPDTGFFKRTFDPTPRNGQSSLSDGFKRTFDPTPRNGQSSLSGSRRAPRQLLNSTPPMQRSTMTGGLVPTRDLYSSTPPYQSPYVPSESGYGALGLDGQFFSSPHRNPDPSQNASTSLHPTKSSLSVVLNSVTPASLYGQSEISRPGSRTVDESRSGSDNPRSALSSTPRRGRPPKASSFVVEIPSHTPKKRERPFSNPRQTPSTDPNYKKRGRPFATAESAARAAAKAARASGAGSDSADGLAKKRGRPFKVRTQQDVPVPEPVFIPFLCEWRDCPAELHNLETLEVHVFNIHNKKQPSGSRLCLWGKCGVKHEPSDEAIDAQPQDQPNKFKSKAEWKDHINRRHLIPFAWHMGDGPKGTSLSIKPNTDPSPWLLDKDGRQVTPSIQNQPIEEGRAKENNARRFVRKIDGIYWVYERIKSPEAYMKVHVPQTGNTSDGDDEDDASMGYL